MQFVTGDIYVGDFQNGLPSMSWEFLFIFDIYMYNINIYW
jgi:hypothetical protein